MTPPAREPADVIEFWFGPPELADTEAVASRWFRKDPAFDHAEDLAAQEEALRLFGRLEQEAPALAGYADHARRHHAAIRRFGRFPHRNAVLGRVSTAQEIEFLKEPGSAF
jgi:uncharacterized protein (DUF924 family)